MTPRTLIGHVAGHARSRPASLAAAWGTVAITYGELWDGVLQAAACLRDEGVQPGDRVLLAAPRDPSFLYAYLACHALAAIAVPCDPDCTPPRLQGIVELLRPRLVLAAREPHPDMPGCGSLPLAALSGSPPGAQTGEFVEPYPDQPADILLTSGTTGEPKGVILTHRNLLAAARNINEFIRNTAHDREAVALPLNHSFGLGRVRCQFLAGGAVILTPGFQFPKQLFEAITRWTATGLSFVPAAWSLLTRLTGERLATFSSQLRYIEIGSAAMPRAEKERLARLFPRTRICMHYGLTEASRSAFIEFHEAGDRLDSIGRPAPNVAIRIVDDEGREVGPRQGGRIQIGGEHVTLGYWEIDAGERLGGGLIYSGDLGYRDEDGYLYLCGREDDVINIGGRKVHPSEIEQALLGHERVGDAVCVGVPDPLTGEAVRAFLVAAEGQGELPSAGMLASFLTGRLEPHKIPSAFEWIAAIPRNGSGKVQRRAVAALHGRPAAPTDAPESR